MIEILDDEFVLINNTKCNMFIKLKFKDKVYIEK